MGKAGDARVQIDVTDELFRQAHDRAAREGYPSTSAWLRRLLMMWDNKPIIPSKRRNRQLSVRLDERHHDQLRRLAKQSQLSKSEAFALLIERALNDQTEPEATPDIPPSSDYERWAALILEAARATPHKLGQNKAFIAGVIDELVARLQPSDPEALRATLRQLLPELNRLDLVPLTRADLVSGHDPDLVRRSAIRYLNAEFHLVDLSQVS